MMVKRAASLFVSVFLAAGFFFTVSIKPAYAYIELGSVGFFIQMLIASTFTALFALKVFWHNVTETISKFFAMVKGTKVKSE